MNIETGTDRPSIIPLIDALRIIRSDDTLFPYGVKGDSITKRSLYVKLFGPDAIHGKNEIVDGKPKHTPGYYEKYPDLSQQQIDEILERNTIKLANTQTLTFFHIFIDRDLISATAAKSAKLQSV